jgi:formylglycine-generating enzyme required for sulfatase activity
MRLVLLPAGKFSMGSGAGEEGPNRAQEQHEVTLTRPFYLGVTEVTQAQYQAVMGALPQRQLTLGADLPVQGVRWDDAMEFCRRLGEREGRTYRLPTEAEWEYACRAGSTGLYGGSGDLDAMAWHSGNADRQVRPVGTKQANHWGLGDMHGNVREWCLDAFALYPKGPRADPVLAGNPRERILRGGSVLTASRQCRCAVRDMGSASVGTPDVGFRVVLETGNPNR